MMLLIEITSSLQKLIKLLLEFWQKLQDYIISKSAIPKSTTTTSTCRQKTKSTLTKCKMTCLCLYIQQQHLRHTTISVPSRSFLAWNSTVLQLVYALKTNGAVMNQHQPRTITGLRPYAGN